MISCTVFAPKQFSERQRQTPLLLFSVFCFRESLRSGRLPTVRVYPKSWAVDNLSVLETARGRECSSILYFRDQNQTSPTLCTGKPKTFPMPKPIHYEAMLRHHILFRAKTCMLSDVLDEICRTLSGLVMDARTLERCVRTRNMAIDTLRVHSVRLATVDK